MLSSAKLRHKVSTLFTAAALVVFGVALNRINVFLVAYKPLYPEQTYFPSFWEILVTAGFIATLVLLYRAFVMIFPVISVPHDESGKPIHVDTSLNPNFTGAK
jgi:Ni/Fe-hydrogenase subunit HybB-like protein